MITGYFVRVERAGKFLSLDIAELSESEIKRVFKDEKPEKLINWIVALAHWARDNGDSL